MSWDRVGNIKGPAGDPEGAIENGFEALIMGQDYVDVTFNAEQVDLYWALRALNIINNIDADPINILTGTLKKTTSGFRLLMSAAPDTPNYVLQWAIIGTPLPPPVPATTYRFNGPTTGVTGSPVTLTIALLPAQTLAAPMTVTPHDLGTLPGTFAPSSVVLTTASPSATVVYTPAYSGARDLTTTNDKGLTDPAAIHFTSTPVLHLLDSLISYWSLDEASGVRADSHGTNNLGAVTGTPGSAPAAVNNGVKFVAANSECIGLLENPSLKVTGDFTFSLWIKLSSQPTSLPFCLFGKAITSNVEYALFYYPTIGFYWQVGAAAAAETGSAVANGVLSHLICSFDSTAGKAKIALNNVAGIDGSPTSLITATNAFILGAIGNPTYYSDAVEDEMFFYKRLLTADEQTALFNKAAYSSFTP